MAAKQIVVKTEYELTDLLRRIEDTDSSRILMNFSEPSALLISPINLKVIREHADSLGKALVMQIIGNDIAIGNAQKAGNIVVDSLGDVAESLWKESESAMKERAVNAKNSKEEANWSDNKGEIAPEPVMGMTPELIAENKSEFSRRVDEALEKSSQVIADSQHRVIEEGNLKLALDHDISEFESAEMPKTLVGVDFMRNTLVPEGEVLAEDSMVADSAAPEPMYAESRTAAASAVAGNVQQKLKAWALTLKEFFITRGWLWKLGLPVILLLILGAFLYYYYFPSAVINMYVAGKEVAVAREFEGRQDVTQSNLDEGYVMIKKETVSKAFAESGGVTGKGVRGEKATGQVRIFSASPDPFVIPSGTKIRSGSGLEYALTSQIEVDPLIPVDAGVQAVDIGEQYNIPAFTTFTMAGYSNVNVTAKDDFKGGSRQEFDTPTQGDIDAVANPLRDRANADIESELRGKAVDGWVIIDSSIYRVVKDGPTPDKAIGAEAQIINVTMTVDGEALYYKQDEFTESAKQLLIDEADKNKLFDTADEGITLELDENIQSDAVAVAEGGKVTVKFNSKGVVRPIINKEMIVNELHKLRSWNQGIDYLKSLDFVSKPTEVIYRPTQFPEWLRYFPNRRGAVIINVNYQQPTPEAETE